MDEKARMKVLGIFKSKQVIISYIILSVIIFAVRGLFFAANYGGVEHDSGWYLGVAKNLAHRGIYASYTNTIEKEGVGAFPSIHGRYSVQDADGYSYFPAGVTVGPGYVVPEALILKVFGDGWWQYRAWPLIGFTGLLVISFSLVYFLGGIIALVIFQVWLWVLPQLTINYVYENYSESIALLFLLLSFWLFFQSYKKKRMPLYAGLSGLFMALSFLTKNLFALGGIAFVIIGLWEIYHFRKEIKTLILRWIFFAIGFMLPFTSFEAYRYVALTSKFGVEGWQAVNDDIRLSYECCGSGINNFDIRKLDIPYILKKFNIWLEVGLYQKIGVWVLFFLLPLASFFVSRDRRVLFFLFWLAAAFSFLWYVFVSPFGWGRHIWQGLMLGIILISVSIGGLLNAKDEFHIKKILATAIILIFIFPIFSLKKAETKFLLNDETIQKWDRYRYEGGLQGFPFLPAFPLNDQQNVINFFSKNIGKSDRIYYEGWLLVAELSPLVDKTFYPLNRYTNDGYQNPDGGRSYLIFGPYQKGRYKIVSDDYIDKMTEKYCQEVIFSNPTHQLCLLKSSI